MYSPVTTSSLKSTRPVAPSKPSVPLPATIGCSQRPRTSEPVDTSGSHLDVNLYVVVNVPTRPPSRLPTNTSSPRSWYTPLGIPLSVALMIFVYQQPSRLPVITIVKSSYPAGGSVHAPVVSKTPTPES